MAVAVLATEPASTSDCVSARVAVAVTLCPGCSVPVAPGQPVYAMVESPGSASAMPTLVRVTLPALRTVKLYVTTSSARPVAPGARLAVLSRVSLGAAVTVGVTRSADDALTDAPPGAAADADARLRIDPEFTSVWVMT